MKSNKKVVILGAGLSGLSAAWHLQKNGQDCVVFEKEKEVGGLCRSKKVNGFIFDCDGHLLHFKNKQTLDLVKRLLNNNIAKHSRSAWVYTRNRLIHYPFHANLRDLPQPIARRCLLDFISASSEKKTNGGTNFLKWVNCSFGKSISRHFMIPYNKKFWTVSLKELTCEWMQDFLVKPTLNHVVQGYCTDEPNYLGYNANFYYPKKGGINQLPLAFESQIRNIYKNSTISSINLKKKEIIIKEQKYAENFDSLILTIPLPELTKIINPLPERILEMLNKLRWNSIFNLNLGIDGNIVDNKHWVYFPQRETSFFRLGFSHNFARKNTPDGKSSVYAEVSYPCTTTIDKTKTVTKILRGLKSIGIIKGRADISALDVNIIKYGYPIYDHNYNQARKEIIKFLLRNNIFPCGRYGNWRYMSMEGAILDGRDVARAI